MQFVRFQLQNVQSLSRMRVVFYSVVSFILIIEAHEFAGYFTELTWYPQDWVLKVKWSGNISLQRLRDVIDFLFRYDIYYSLESFAYWVFIASHLQYFVRQLSIMALITFVSLLIFIEVREVKKMKQKQGTSLGLSCAIVCRDTSLMGFLERFGTSARDLRWQRVNN